MEVKGYKAFNKNKQNRYGVPFLEGHTYRVLGPVSFGCNGNGYHFCRELSDVFRYVDNNEEVCVASVTGSGEMVTFNDEYYGYYDMYSSEILRVDRFLSREEIIDIMLNSNEEAIRKFLLFFRLNSLELSLFVNRFGSNMKIMEFIMYYQMGCKDIYMQDYGHRQEIVRKVLMYGQNSNKGS
ncbi:MAG TPA: hypothetical protein DCE23_07060 [Firmicutes bacterium]|nr:hypothetical protein [Bacillota bacterium]